MGQLTTIGALQHRKLGENLREIYIKQLGLLPNEFDSKYYFIRSIDESRTIQSFENLIYGLYPSINSSTFTDITFYVIDQCSDVIFLK